MKKNATDTPIELSDDWRVLLQKEKEFLNETRQNLKKTWYKHRRPARFFQAWRHHVDTILQRLWQALDLPKDLVLMALGGYGRGELYPFSDLDLLILLPDGKAANLAHTALADFSPFCPPEKTKPAPKSIAKDTQNKIAAWLSALWDIGFDIGHSVHHVSEALQFAAQDLIFETSLLECRFLAGDAALFRQWQQHLSHFHNVPVFIERKLQEQSQRHQRFSTSETNLEPNVKDLAGGLRDLQLWIWLARATGLGKELYDFEQKHWLTRQETRQLKTARYCLQSLRIDLHFLAGRKEDRLLWNFQTQIAELWQLKDNRSSRASELLMRRYYRAAQIIRQINDILLPQFRQWLPLAHKNPPKKQNCPPENSALAQHAYFQIEDGLLSIKDARAYRQHAFLILETFLLLAQHRELAGINSKTLRALWHARLSINARFRANPKHRRQFLKIFQQKNSLSRVLYMMHNYGILGRYLPAFANITGRMQHDLFHIHTVDIHILRVIQNLRGFLDASAAQRDPVLARLMHNFDRPEVLFLAGLFHDIGKGRQGDHSILGAEDAKQFAKNHQLLPEDQTLLVWLVKQHLMMSSTAQKQDVYDPQVIEKFALFVQTPRRLIALYLLTVADIRATNPKIWNAWKAKLLDTLFHASLNRLENGEQFDINRSINTRKRAAQQAFLAQHAEPPERIWRYFDSHYFLRYDAQEIVWHLSLIKDQLHTSSAKVWAKCAEHREGLDVCVYAPDTPDLFSRICQFFSGTAYNIVEARIEITQHAYALNTFHILAPKDRLDSDSLNLIHRDLTASLAPHAPPPKLKKQHQIDRHQKNFPIEPHIQFQIDESDFKTTLFIVAGDRQGLLADMAALFARYQIHVHAAKIMTLANRIEDIFVLSSYHLKNDHFLFQMKQELLDILQHPQHKPSIKPHKSRIKLIQKNKEAGTKHEQ